MRTLKRLEALASLVVQCADAGFVQAIENVAALIADRVARGGKVLVCGNGGSAAQAQHFAAELVGRYRKERRALPAIALTTDTSILTSLANDYSFERIFSRQVEALGSPGDVLIALSTSGGSVNVIEAVFAAQKIGMSTIAITGNGDRNGLALANVDVHISIPSADTALIQELTTHVVHTIAEIVEERCG